MSRVAITTFVVCSFASSAFAADAEEETKTPISNASEAATKTEPAKKTELVLTGWVEAFYQWSIGRPSNRITNFRGFDTRSETFTLSNAVVDAAWSRDRMRGHLALQVGHTPETYYLAEPSLAGAAGAGESNFRVWKLLQQANIGWNAPIGRGLLFEAGLFLSPIGPEGMAVKDQWNWSRSNLFFGLPFYHTGARATYPLTEKLSATAHVYNGWNSLVDNNRFKSGAFSVTYNDPDKLLIQVLYFGGVERPTAAAEGNAARHLFDGYVQFTPTKRVSLMLHGDVGFENNHFGRSTWAAAAAYARVELASFLFVAIRGDRFHEKAASNAEGAASSLFWPTAGSSGGVTSGTVTLDARPVDGVSIRLEVRHDQGEVPMYFRGDVATDATTGAFLPNSKSQDTLTLGATTWF